MQIYLNFMGTTQPGVPLVVCIPQFENHFCGRYLEGTLKLFNYTTM